MISCFLASSARMIIPIGHSKKIGWPRHALAGWIAGGGFG